MKKNVTVLYHRDADGFGAAFALWNLYGDEAKYISVQYGEPVPEIPEGTKTLYIVDFSYDRATCDALSKKYDLTVIDHHKTAESELEGAEYAVFDMKHSGCILTWKHIFPAGVTPPPILRYVEDRDLWKFELNMSEEINLYISSLDNDFGDWDSFWAGDAEIAGKALKAFRDNQIKSVVKSARYDVLECHKVVVANCSANVSETGHQLLNHFPKAKFSVTYCDRRDGLRSYSLRSRGDFDVSEIAKMYSGGGHPAAAGFTTSSPEWITFNETNQKENK